MKITFNHNLGKRISPGKKKYKFKSNQKIISSKKRNFGNRSQKSRNRGTKKLKSPT